MFRRVVRVCCGSISTTSTGYDVAPTEAAENLMPVPEEIEEVMARFASEAEGLERVIAGWVRIARPSDTAEVIVVPLVPELLAKFPALRVEIDPGETVLDLTRREADLALRSPLSKLLHRARGAALA